MLAGISTNVIAVKGELSIEKVAAALEEDRYSLTAELTLTRLSLASRNSITIGKSEGLPAVIFCEALVITMAAGGAVVNELTALFGLHIRAPYASNAATRHQYVVLAFNAPAVGNVKDAVAP